MKNSERIPQDVTDGEQLRLFEKVQRVPALKIVVITPTEDEIGEALLWGARLAVQRRLVGELNGMDRDDVTSEVIVRALGRVRKWRGDGRKSIKEYAYISACFALTDMIRSRMQIDEGEVDVIDSPDTISFNLLGEAC